MNESLNQKILKENPPYEIENLNEETILEDEIFDYLLEIPNSPDKTRIIEKLRNKARELKVIRAFNNIFKQKNQEYIQSLKSQGGNKTKFTDCPYEQLNCGTWNADDTGIYKMDYNTIMQPIKIKACSHPIIPVERLINIDTNIEKIKLAFYKDKKWQYIIAEKNTIASKSKIIQLANLGIEVNENNAKELITYLADVMELNNIEPKISVGHLGWIDKEFVPYSDKYCLDVDKEFKQKINNISEHGSYEEWKEYIKKLRKNSITLRFMIASSFASVLVRIFKLNTFIVHLWGKSGNGKTVAEMICASIWGKPDNNFISNLSNTSIANERLCNFYKNMPILLDELQIAKAKYKNFDELIYILTEGKGKERGTVDNGIREQTSWQTIVILNGEEPITSDTSKEGVKNRVIEINEDNIIVEDGNATVKFIQNNYGFAGKEFIKLIENREELQRIQQHFVKELNEIIEYKKQINAFSIIMTADYIVSKKIFKDEPISIEEIKGYIREDTDETERYYSYLLDQISINKNKFYKRADNSNEWITPNGEIWGKIEQTNEFSHNRSTICYYVYPEIARKIFSETSENWNSIKKKLADKDYIKTSNDKGYIRYTVKEIMPEGRRNMIQINFR
mgnify:FL=1